MSSITAQVRTTRSKPRDRWSARTNPSPRPTSLDRVARLKIVCQSRFLVHRRLDTSAELDKLRHTQKRLAAHFSFPTMCAHLRTPPSSHLGLFGSFGCPPCCSCSDLSGVFLIACVSALLVYISSRTFKRWSSLLWRPEVDPS